MDVLLKIPVASTPTLQELYTKTLREMPNADEETQMFHTLFKAAMHLLYTGQYITKDHPSPGASGAFDVEMPADDAFVIVHVAFHENGQAYNFHVRVMLDGDKPVQGTVETN